MPFEAKELLMGLEKLGRRPEMGFSRDNRRDDTRGLRFEDNSPLPFSTSMFSYPQTTQITQIQKIANYELPIADFLALKDTYTRDWQCRLTKSTIGNRQLAVFL